MSCLFSGGVYCSYLKTIFPSTFAQGKSLHELLPKVGAKISDNLTAVEVVFPFGKGWIFVGPYPAGGDFKMFSYL